MVLVDTDSGFIIFVLKNAAALLSSSVDRVQLSDIHRNPPRLGRMYAGRGSNFANEALEKCFARNSKNVLRIKI
jgi:hypothetical protein